VIIKSNITAAAWTAGFHWWRSGNITRMQNVSEYMLVLALCLVKISQHLVKLWVRTLIALSPLCARALSCWKMKNSLEPWHMAAETCAKTVRSCFKKGRDWLGEKSMD